MRKLLDAGWKQRETKLNTIYSAPGRPEVLLMVSNDGDITGVAPGYNAGFERNEAAAVEWALKQAA